MKSPLLPLELFAQADAETLALFDVQVDDADDPIALLKRLLDQQRELMEGATAAA